MQWLFFLLVFIGIPFYMAYPNLKKNEVKQLSLSFLQTGDKLENFIEENITAKSFGKSTEIQSEKFTFRQGNFDFSKRIDYTKKVTNFEIISLTGLVRVYWTQDEHGISGNIYLGPKEQMMLYLTKGNNEWFFVENQEDKIFKPQNFDKYEKVLADLKQLYRDDKKTPKIKQGK